MYIATKIKSISEYEDSWFEEALDFLPSWRKEKTKRIRDEKTRKTSILAGKLLYDAFLENDEDPESVTFGENGKPEAPSGSNFCFSISHSKNAVALSYLEKTTSHSSLPVERRIDATSVFSAASIPPRSDLKATRGLSFPSVGIDIEYIREYDREIAERFFTKEEQDYLEFSDNKNEDYTRIWTSKEAYGKFTGGGVKDGLAYSIFHDPTIPMDVILPCFFEHLEKEIDGERYLYTICYGVLEKPE